MIPLQNFKTIQILFKMYSKAGGIGKCLVREFLNQDCYVLCVDMDRSSLMKLEQELDENTKDRVYFFEADLTSMPQISDLFARVEFIVAHKIGRPVDILVNNAGTMNKCKSFLELSDAEVSHILELNVLAPIRLCQLFLPDMVRRNRGHVINMTSSLAVYGTYGVVDYCSTKFALFGFTEALRVELKTANRNNQVRVTLVCPFHVKTPLFGGFELPTLKWLNTSITPQSVASDVVNGVLLDKELIGCPNYTFYIFSAIKL
jgi:all-trans-retinol dehydrogenase (NAD+)